MKQSLATTVTIVGLGVAAAASRLFAPLALLVGIGALIAFAELCHAFARTRAARGAAAPDPTERAILVAMLVTSSSVLFCVGATIGSGRSELVAAVPFLLGLLAAMIREAHQTGKRRGLVPIAGCVLLAVVWIAEDHRGASGIDPLTTASTAGR